MYTLKLQTPVAPADSPVKVGLQDPVTVLGSCFADRIGERMREAGFDACVNPTGTLYNPVSICNTAARLSSGIPFKEQDCVQMGAGSPLWCSFSHHTSFARETKEAFLENANRKLEEAAACWKRSTRVVITLGTAWCHTWIPSGEIVANCLKIDGRQFIRKRLSVQETTLMLESLVRAHPDKSFVLTVSPVRHTADGAHGNQLGKATLLLATDAICMAFPDRCAYFPAYEILMDELRDYRFYAADMVHPTDQAADLVWQRFMESFVEESDHGRIGENERKRLQEKHVRMH